jgi:phosphoglycolate phosphatase
MRILFDLDGTLTDSFVGITNCIRHALKTLDHDAPPAEDLGWCIGPPLQESFLSLLSTTDEQLASKAVGYYRERFGTIGLFENEVYPGVVSGLQELTRGGHTLSVATSKPRVYARRIVEHFDLMGYFCAVDGSELDGSHGDKAALIGHVLERDRLDPGKVVMIGDRKHDMMGAAENHVCGIGVLWGYGSIDELRAAGAYLCIDAPNKLSDAVERAETRSA